MKRQNSRINSRQIRLIDDVNFVIATRETGYRSTAYAIAELIDNAIQAGARNIHITTETNAEQVTHVAVLDDGVGISKAMIPTALQFGGSDRFNSRGGIGRFGMGLPNSSLSQARRVELYSWRGNQSWFSYIDVDEIAAGQMTSVPLPRTATPPIWVHRPLPSIGTLVVWA